MVMKVVPISDARLMALVNSYKGMGKHALTLSNGSAHQEHREEYLAIARDHLDVAAALLELAGKRAAEEAFAGQMAMIERDALATWNSNEAQQ
jgi:hypothetical protein